MVNKHLTRYSMPLLIAIALFFTDFAYASEPIGKLIFTIGKMQIIKEKGKQKIARRGDNIFQGDTIKTFMKGQAQIKFVDGTRISIRADSELKVDTYVYRDNPEKDKSEMSLLRGGIRAITGAIGRKNKKSYKMKTAVATIGIRGTDYSLMLCQSKCKTGPNEKINSGLYVGVINGGVTLSNKMGTITLDKNQYATAEAFNIKPRMLLKPPSFLMFDRAEATRSDRINIKSSLAKRKNIGRNRSATQNGEPLSSRSNVLPISVSKRISGASAEIPSQVKSELEQMFNENNNKLSAANRELAKSLFSEFDNKETAEKIINLLSQNSEEISIIEAFLTQEDIASDLSGGCNSLFGSACDTFSGVAGSDPNSLVNNENNPPVVGNDDDNPPQISPLPRFFTSSLETGNLVYEYVESSDATKVSAFYQSYSADLTFENFSRYELDTAELDDYGLDVETGLSWGRWSNGSIKKTLLTIDNAMLESLDFTNQSLHWVQGLDGSDNIQLPITGTRDFTLTGNTQPTDNLGNSGTLGSASLFANFETNTVDADVTLSINQQLWNAEQKNISLNNNGKFFSDTLNVQVFDATGTTTGDGGRVSGGLTTMPSNGGAFIYSLDATINGQATTVDGAAIFKETQ